MKKQIIIIAGIILPFIAAAIAMVTVVTNNKKEEEALTGQVFPFTYINLEMSEAEAKKAESGGEYDEAGILSFDKEYQGLKGRLTYQEDKAVIQWQSEDEDEAALDAAWPVILESFESLYGEPELQEMESDAVWMYYWEHNSYYVHLEYFRSRELLSIKVLDIRVYQDN